MAKDDKQIIPNGIQVPEAYANTAKVNFSPYEFEITMGLGSANYEGIRPVVNIRVSPQFTKELAKILTENVALYEEHVGKILELENGKKK